MTYVLWSLFVLFVPGTIPIYQRYLKKLLTFPAPANILRKLNSAG